MAAPSEALRAACLACMLAAYSAERWARKRAVSKVGPWDWLEADLWVDSRAAYWAAVWVC